jgi:RsiW-degrading membrane proteinase PrsW (M82 family)
MKRRIANAIYRTGIAVALVLFALLVCLGIYAVTQEYQKNPSDTLIGILLAGGLFLFALALACVFTWAQFNRK